MAGKAMVHKDKQKTEASNSLKSILNIFHQFCNTNNCPSDAHLLNESFLYIFTAAKNTTYL